MTSDRATDLARACTDLAHNGMDFPTIWSTRLKNHALINGIPHQKRDGTRSMLEVQLITGERLVFDGDAKKFTVE
jgi:hypothetical protein